MAAARLRDLRQDADQLGLLSRHFFERLFRNDFVDFEDQMKARLVAVLAVLAVVVGWSSQLLVFFRYELSPDAGTSWQEKNYIFILMMLLFGVVTLLDWEALFPDRRDFVNLTPLPVRLRTIFAAKLVSFLAFIGLFSAAMNSLSSVVFALFLAQWRSNSLLFLGWHVLAHLASAFAACFCVFFACVFVNFFLMALLPASLYRRASALVRFVLIGFCLFLLLAFLVEPGNMSGALRSLPRLKDHGSPLVGHVPSMWFVGLYEVLLGTAGPVFKGLARTAVGALGLSLGAFGLACGLSYLKHFRRTLEASKRRPQARRLREGAAGLVEAIYLRSPEARAVGGFFSRTVRSSPRHRAVIVNGLAAGAALATLAVVANRRNLQALSPSNAYFLSQSLLLVFVLLGALRAAADQPAALESNWIFRLTEAPRRDRYAAGLKNTVLVRWCLPLAALLFAGHWGLWRDAGAAALHALFCLALAALGTELFFFHYPKIPFACTRVPGKLRLQTRAVPYVVGILGLLAALSGFEKALLARPGSFRVFAAAAAALWAVLRTVNARFLRNHALVFDEEPEPAMIGFPEDA